MTWIQKILCVLFGASVAEEPLSLKSHSVAASLGDLLEGSLLAELKKSESAEVLKELLDTLTGNDAHLTRHTSWESSALYD